MKPTGMQAKGSGSTSTNIDLEPDAQAKVIDIGDPENPAFVTIVEPLRPPTFTEVSGPFLCMTDDFFGLSTYRALGDP